MARVKDELVTKAAEALVEVVKSMTNEQGLSIACPFDLYKAKGAVLSVMVSAVGYPNSVMPTGWIEVSNFGGASNGA